MPNIWDDQLEDQNNIRYVSGTKIVSCNLILFRYLLIILFSGISSYIQQASNKIDLRSRFRYHKITHGCTLQLLINIIM